MDRIIPRLQVFEIDDQSWFPALLRARVQAILTHLWTTRLPPLQPVSPATQTAHILLCLFGDSFRSYTVVDFCAGAGGPTSAIERVVNTTLAQSSDSLNSTSSVDAGNPPNTALRQRTTSRDPGPATSDVAFVLTDLAPHPAAWHPLCASRPSLHYVAAPVDAAAAPDSHALLAGLGLPTDRRILRTFHLSFHHFPDALAVAILRDTFRTADAVAIVELIERSAASLLMEALMVVPMAVLTPWWACVGAGPGDAGRGWGVGGGVDWVLLFFTYVLPIVPFVVVFDGWMSSLRARTPGEVMALVERAKREPGTEAGLGEDWEWESGRECHTWPIGYTTYVVGRKKG